MRGLLIPLVGGVIRWQMTRRVDEGERKEEKKNYISSRRRISRGEGEGPRWARGAMVGGGSWAVVAVRQGKGKRGGRCLLLVLSEGRGRYRDCAGNENGGPQSSSSGEKPYLLEGTNPVWQWRKAKVFEKGGERKEGRGRQPYH